jgi:hypothetical protein
VLVEIHGPHLDQLEIGRRVDLVYDVALPPLTLDALYRRAGPGCSRPSRSTTWSSPSTNTPAAPAGPPPAPPARTSISTRSTAPSTTHSDFQFATAQVSQVTLLTVLRQVDLDPLRRERETISGRLRTLIDSATEPWGVEVTMVEIKDVELPEQMKRVMAREAESERERRAKKIHAQGELEAAETLASAAGEMERHPIALQLRTLDPGSPADEPAGFVT